MTELKICFCLFFSSSGPLKSRPSVHKVDGKSIICAECRTYRHMDSPADVHQVNRRCEGAGMDEFGELINHTLIHVL